MKKRFGFTIVCALIMATLIGAGSALAEPWKFGVMSDTQWKANVDGKNPATVAVGIIDQLNQEFIKHGVKFVVQVGDLTDKEADPAMDTRVAAAQALYDAGIGFFPLRGNHEASQAAALKFQTVYPQAVGQGAHVFGAKNFSSPFASLDGLSYAFDYRNAQFVLLDQFTRTDNTNYLGSSNNNIIDQQGWIDGTLAARPAHTHAFVFSHKNLIGQNHVDALFGANPSSNPAAQDAFITSLAVNGVRYHFGGHDHMHNRAIVKSPNSSAAVQDIIASSNSYKFYIPAVPSNDATYNTPVNGITGPRETPVAQELFTVGYYIVTVDGPQVTVDHYASPNGCVGDCDLVNTPVLTFSKRETFGYSLNGEEFLVAQGESYTKIADKSLYSRTVARILAGNNESTAKDYAARPFTKAVDTGWSRGECGMASDILTLWGMARALGSDETDVYTLSMSYDHRGISERELRQGRFGLVTMDENGELVNAVDQNYGGTKQFVYGSWRPSYGLGTYGVDPRTRTAWAVLNHDGAFAADDGRLTIWERLQCWKRIWEQKMHP